MTPAALEFEDSLNDLPPANTQISQLAVEMSQVALCRIDGALLHFWDRFVPRLAAGPSQTYAVLAPVIKCTTKEMTAKRSKM